MSRVWYVSPIRVIPGCSVPGRWEPSFTDYVGPSPQLMTLFRGPEDTCDKVIRHAAKWRLDGRTSDLFLLLVEDGVASHCQKYDPLTKGKAKS